MFQDTLVLLRPHTPVAGWNGDALLGTARQPKEGQPFLYAFARRCIKRGMFRM